MIKSCALFTVVLLAFLTPSLAQTQPGADPDEPPAAAMTPPPPGAAMPPPPPGARAASGMPDMRDVRDQCRDQLSQNPMRGEARRQAMMDCIVKQRPDMAARMKCAMDPSVRALDKDAKRAAIQACIRNTRG